MNKRGFSPITLFFVDILLLLLWAFFLSGVFVMAGNAALANGETGIGAFLWANLNGMFFFCLILLNLAGLYVGGGQ